jgi:hypothetical protein
MINIDESSSLSDEGVWVDFEGSRFLIAHLSNMKFQRTFARLQQPYRKKIEAGTLDPEISKKLLCQAMSEGILLNWDNVTNKSGVIQYSPEFGFKLLMNNPAVREFISEYASNIDNFRQIEDLGKN